MSIASSYGGARYLRHSLKVIRLIRKGCANRPFYHISVMENIKEPYEPVIEQLGSFDPLPNKYNEKLVAINFDRLELWLRRGAKLTDPVNEILGLSGYFQVSPNSYRKAWLNRKKIKETLEELKITAASFSQVETSTPTESSSSSSDSTSGEVESPGKEEEPGDPESSKKESPPPETTS